ncbi:diacylglycerol/polyprenol kinase family protein [Deinococcus maricopensis]|uniref:Phosphatidate cytidylyltransferase n=1 Tax=Deinococcus maricopensis (strain DSM 21211 / LMG 22137 / NRRL B-23946 / LB-34) TaxID=709986 RepID=E8U6X7_DEIML|nr:phosphatidate cytidylyltransferase [Deinococcus maricopensis]ADV66816.1 phosphatidate cytidylyltransferase [Deinococcus maricopensis DSM 21211]
MTPTGGILVAATLLLALLGGARTLQVRARLHPEVARKCMHVGVGLIALSFPWLLREAWAVWTVCAVAVFTLVSLRVVRTLRDNVSGVLLSVERTSLGDVYFLGAVGALFTLAGRDTLLYVIPLLVLTFADAVAALIGVRYGQRRFVAADGVKSVEGSAAFALAAFFATHVPLLLFTDVGRAETLVLSALVGVLVMLLEAVAWEGLDNLFIPLGTLVVLRGHLSVPLDVQVLHLLLALALTALVFAARRALPLTAGALIGAAFIVYVCGTVGGPAWMYAPITVAAAWGVLRVMDPRAPGEYGVQAVGSLAAPALLWLLSARYLDRPQDAFPFTVAWAAQLACLWTFVYAPGPGRLPSPLPTVLSGALLLLPYVVMSGADRADWARGAAGVLAVAAAVLTCAALRTRAPLPLSTQVTVAGLASLVGFLPLAP